VAGPVRGPPASGDLQRVQVFERFYRVDGSRTRASGGVGLGLSIVAAVVHAHGGEATAGQAPGGGAAFTITLPLAGRSP
jgi:two-component system, OmpR family, sensor kinase